MRKSPAIAAAVVTFAASIAGFTASASAYAPCGSAPPPDIDHSAYVTSYTTVQLHNGSNIGCAALADLHQGDRADYYCFTRNPTSGLTWTYLRDVTTGYKGWARDDNLPGYGSNVECSF